MTMASMYFDYANVAVFFVFAVVFVILNISVISVILRPTVENDQKDTTYECGEPSVGSSWVRFDMRFYTVALVFLIFDVEVAFLYPWAVVFKDLRGAIGGSATGVFVFLEAAIFLLILFVGLIYVWKRGDLDWVKSSSAQEVDARQRQMIEAKDEVRL
ncbi:MAG: NADH-quinone oxidoreductase subunit A [Planctomycetota bacterium]|jgi:NADH-quinone oxidoreductase subunit A|nr:NADH-quinone oxidoreductase subunit A [Planctomycetota bacterium]